MTAARPKFAAVMVMFKVTKGCTPGRARHLAWNNNLGSSIYLEPAEERDAGVSELHVRLSRGYAAYHRPVMVSQFDLRQLIRAAENHHEDVTSGLAEHVYDDPDEGARMEVLNHVLRRARAVAK